MKHWIALVAVAGLVAGCGDTIKGTEYAEATVAQFREQMSAGHFDRIYDAAGEEFKAATTRDVGVALFAAVDRKLGKLQKAEQINWSVNTHNMTTLAVLVYDSQYAEDRATETFTVKIDDGKGELVGYNIQSLQMLIK